MIKINKDDLLKASEKGLIGKTRIEKLWAYWSDNTEQVLPVVEAKPAVQETPSSHLSFKTVAMWLGGTLLLMPLLWLFVMFIDGHLSAALSHLFLLMSSLSFLIFAGMGCVFCSHQQLQKMSAGFMVIAVLLASFLSYAVFKEFGHFSQEDNMLASPAVALVLLVCFYARCRFNALMGLGLLCLTWMSLSVVMRYFPMGVHFRPGLYSLWALGTVILLVNLWLAKIKHSLGNSAWFDWVGGLNFWVGSSVLTSFPALYGNFVWLGLNVLIFCYSYYRSRRAFLILGVLGISIELIFNFYEWYLHQPVLIFGVAFCGVFVLLLVGVLSRLPRFSKKTDI